ncbi:hypothetical protein H7J77_00480 [Mycolicibacillus parakoreensis]|uniref:Low molecular weight antigen MTB12-like C-terminal domain-containing protein n=1 Tax=Mycolicibacillus parakoreensis TaxID=1069221 RepID=A0ABY3U4P3_9MYCO|nr:hypothetical protein [Mycolicibacillus parakoreensis]MCV7314028.1 hypothetical protein [Mycolicibacillus parakoreensis]ULN54110.1 hypothetical protein MIU77_07530 [Mycolicibacillus parakoreensis]
MRRTLTAVGGSAVLAAALILPGCAPEATAPPTSSPSVPVSSTAPAPPVDPGLPDPGALTDVLYRLADPGLPGAEKLPLVQGASDGDAETLDRFAAAMHDNGYRPATFTAADLGWADGGPPDDVLATITVSKDGDEGGFSLPMEFVRDHDQWQLSQDTFTMLMDVQAPAPESPTEAPAEAPPPAEPEAPEPPG